MERLRQIREQAGYSQQELADESGVSQHTISEIELGRRKPQGRTLRKLAQVLGVEVRDFFEESARPLVEAPPSQPSLNHLLAEERHTEWNKAVSSARQLQEHGRTRTEELLALWQESKERGEAPAERRAYLDEIGGLLQRAYDAEMALFANLEAGLAAGDREAANLLAAGAKEVPNPGWTEVQAADRFYLDLFGLVQGAGLSIRTDGAQEGEAAHAGQAAAHAVEEPHAA